MSEKEDKREGITDVIKKVVSIGAGAAFLTEDAVKTIVKDLPLPKDVISGLLQNAKGAKEELAKALQDEFRKYLSHVDVNRIVDYLVENYDVEVNAKFSFKKKSKSEKTKEKHKKK